MKSKFMLVMALGLASAVSAFAAESNAVKDGCDGITQVSQTKDVEIIYVSSTDKDAAPKSAKAVVEAEVAK